MELATKRGWLDQVPAAVVGAARGQGLDGGGPLLLTDASGHDGRSIARPLLQLGDVASKAATDDLARELQAAIANASSCNASTYAPNDCRCWMWSTPQMDACAAAEDTTWKGHQVGTWPPTAEEPGLPLFEMARWDGGLLQSYRCPA